MSGTKAASRLPQILERFRSSMNLKFTVDGKVPYLNCSVPGFKYDDFDRSGFLNLAKVNRMLEMSRLNESILISPEFHATKLRAFMLGSQLKASKHLYKTAAVDQPMKFHMQLCNAGKSSIDAEQSLIDDQTGIVLVQRIIRIVNIDPLTKTAAPISDDLRRLLKGKIHKSDDNQLPHLEFPADVPGKHFVHCETVRFSDMDFVFHCNQGSYLLYTFECAAMAASKGFYSRILDDVCFYPAKSVLGLHVAECFAGDALQVLTWEDEKNPMLIYFVVKNKNGIAYHAKVEFYSPEELT